MMKIEVVDVVEHPEDGSATYTFEADDGSQKVLSELGLKLLLYCAAAGISTEDALANIMATVESREARDKRVRDEALREAVEVCTKIIDRTISLPMQQGAWAAKKEILALIEGDQTDE